jgi:hypothetical protein
MPRGIETAEQRFRAAFIRLKENIPQVLSRGAQVSQNNVAKEAGADPSALRKARYPALIREIQAHVELSDAREAKAKIRRERRQENRQTLEEQVQTLTEQRDRAQSELVSAHRIILNLLQENSLLQQSIERVRPPPTPLRK